jgi:hypothetical protein
MDTNSKNIWQQAADDTDRKYVDLYPVYECGGAEDALLAMAPEWKPDVRN